jgi:CBS domain-containing protein
LITVNSTTTALQIAKMMDQGGVSAIFVKENDHPVGVVTDRDFAIKVAANNLSFDTLLKNNVIPSSYHKPQ